MIKRSDEHAPLTIHEHIQAVRRNAEFLSEAQASLRRTEQEMHALPREQKRIRIIRDFTDNEVARKWGVPPEVVLGAGSMALNGQTHGHSDENKCPPLPDGHARRMMVLDIQDARYLTLKIDLTLPEAESLKHAQAEISRYQTLLRLKSRRRNKPTLVDPWLVYDLVHNGKRNLLQITHDLFKCKGTPAYDDKVNRYYRCVQRAYRNAEAMIKSVSRSNPS